MATRIRLRRVGRKRQPSFRIVVAGSMHARDGRVSETIGKYNPRTNPSYIEVDEKRALYWLKEGAEMSESVNALFRKAGILKKLATGAEAEGSVVIGDPQGRTVLSAKPKAVKVEPSAEKKPAKAEAKPEATAEEKPSKAEAAAEKKQAKAEAKAEVSEPSEAESEEKQEG